LRSEALEDAENERIFGKCANPNGHGHNYGVEVSVAGAVDEQTGQIVPIEDLDRIFDRSVRERFSHRMLNELEPFASCVPTAENIARVIHDVLAPEVAQATGARLVRVRIVETRRNTFEYGEMV
jgi:6-pyruvoyltetrahydropterin/6-carboxytetrahydropterin synthase